MDNPLDQKISPAQLKALTDLLSDLAEITSVRGVVAICSDGNTIVGKLASDIDMELLKTNSVSIFAMSQQTALAMNHNVLEEVILKSQNGYLYLTSFGTGLIILLSDGEMPELI